MAFPGASDYVAAFTADFSFDAARTCLVVVDLQYATGSPNHGLGRRLGEEGRKEEASYRFRRIKEYVVPNTIRLLDAFREQNRRVLYFTYGSEVVDYSDLGPQLRALCEGIANRRGEKEHEILEDVRPRPGERVINKLTPSGFNGTPADLVLRSYGVDTLVFVGVSTNMCVEHTLRDASDRGYRCILVDDACGADSQDMHDSTLQNVPRLYGKIANTDEVISLLAK